MKKDDILDDIKEDIDLSEVKNTTKDQIKDPFQEEIDELDDAAKNTIALRRQLIEFYSKEQLVKIYEFSLKNPEVVLTKPQIDEILEIDQDGLSIK